MAQDERRWLLGPGLTLLALVLAEAALRTLPEPGPVAFLILALLPVAYAGLSGGLGPGLLSALLVALFTVHFSSEPTSPFSPTFVTLQGGAIMLVLGVAMAGAMAFVRRREDGLRSAVADRAAELERRNAELTEANETLEAFGFVISHDLKEPVRAIGSYLEAAEDAYGTPEGRDDLAKAAEANRRLVRLLQGLLSYARASSLAPAPRPLRVADVLAGDACRAQFDGVLRERGARIDVDPDLPDVLGDEVILAQLLGNLILNAVRHNPSPAPRVRIRSEPPDKPGLVHLVVEDNGPGYPADVLRRFERLKAGRPATVRTGFGLVISQRAAQRLGGTLRLENGGSGGGCAHVELPAASAS